MATAAKPIADLMHLIAANLRDLLELELSLGKAEAKQTLGDSKNGVTIILFASTTLVLSMLFGSLAAMLALAKLMPHWAAALIVGGMLLLIASVSLRAGIRKLKAVEILPATHTTMKENLRWETPSKT